MGLSVSKLYSEADLQLVDEGQEGEILTIRSDDAGLNKSGFELIKVEYDSGGGDPDFTVKYMDILGSSEVASTDEIEDALHEARDAAESKLIGNPRL